MSLQWLSIALTVVILSPLQVRADDSAASDDIPLVDRPADLPFSGASGSFTVEARAEPTAGRRDEAIVFTVTVRSTGTVHQAPDRLDLRQMPAFADRFYFEDPEQKLRRPDDRTWEFVYRLKVRRDDVTEIPALGFVYYDPAIRPSKRGFQIAFTDAIPLTLRPAESYVPAPLLPPELYRMDGGQELLAHPRSPLLPRSLLITLLLAGPPLVCAGWYGVWRSRHPDAARLTRRRRSRAARESLKRLRNARRLPLPQRADATAAALTGYLHERFELTTAEPTPAEAAAALRQAGCPIDLADGASRFVTHSDAARFAPEADGVTLIDEAVRLIAALEEGTWESLRS
jgi:hypothetical protein